MKQQLEIRKVGIVHGYAGSGATHWQSWLERRCKTFGTETHFPKLPDRFSLPKLSAWLEALDRTMPIIDDTTALIGHSLGCPTIFQLLKSDRIKQVGLVALVAPSSRIRVEGSSLPEQLKSTVMGFYDDFDPTYVADKAKRIEIYASDNDMWVDPDITFQLALGMRANFHLIHGAGHFSPSNGHYKFPEIFDLIRCCTM